MASLNINAPMSVLRRQKSTPALRGKQGKGKEANSGRIRAFQEREQRAEWLFRRRTGGACSYPIRACQSGRRSDNSQAAR
jgi:hypothetical protein